MREMNIAIAMIRQGDEYLLQLRKGNPSIGATGLIGFFGGKLEPGESAATAVSREIGEETSLQTNPDDFSVVGPIAVESDHGLQVVSILGTVFQIALPVGAEITAHEGELVRIASDQVLGRLHEMTPGTRQAFEKYVIGEE